MATPLSGARRSGRGRSVSMAGTAAEAAVRKMSRSSGAHVRSRSWLMDDRSVIGSAGVGTRFGVAGVITVAGLTGVAGVAGVAVVAGNSDGRAIPAILGGSERLTVARHISRSSSAIGGGAIGEGGTTAIIARGTADSSSVTPRRSVSGSLTTTSTSLRSMGAFVPSAATDAVSLSSKRARSRLMPMPTANSSSSRSDSRTVGSVGGAMDAPGNGGNPLPVVSCRPTSRDGSVGGAGKTACRTAAKEMPSAAGTEVSSGMSARLCLVGAGLSSIRKSDSGTAMGADYSCRLD